MTTNAASPSHTPPATADAVAEERLARVITSIDRANEADPTLVTLEGIAFPLALAEGRMAYDWVLRLRGDHGLNVEAPAAPLLIAARGHHIRRWETPRDSYPRDRAGYQAWRLRLADVHARHLAGIMRAEGYREGDVEAVDLLVHKRDIKTAADAQTFEDAVALAFLEVQFASFAARSPRGTVVRALRRTWHKMSDRGRDAALGLPLSSELRALVEEAVSSDARAAAQGAS